MSLPSFIKNLFVKGEYDMTTVYTQTMQRAQNHVQAQEYKPALQWGHKALALKNIGLEQKLQTIDFIALCYRQLQLDKKVYLQLKNSIKYLDRFVAKPFSFSMYCNYIEALINLGLEQEAQKRLLYGPERYLKRAKKDLHWAQAYLTIKRLQYLFDKKYESEKKAWATIEAIDELSQLTDDSEMMDFAKQELALYPYYEEGQVFYFQEWTYLKEDGLALFPREKRVVKLHENEAVRNIVEILMPEPMQLARFFKAVTSKTYNPSIHKRPLTNILTTIQRTLSPDSLVLHEESIGLV